MVPSTAAYSAHGREVLLAEDLLLRLELEDGNLDLLFLFTVLMKCNLCTDSGSPGKLYQPLLERSHYCIQQGKRPFVAVG